MLALVMDGIVAILLVATIGFAIRLNGKLGLLNRERENMERLISGLHSASRQAEEAVAGLRQAAVENGQSLQTVADKAAALKQDLEFLIDKGNGVADRLEGGLKPNRHKSTSAAPPAVVPILSEIRPGAGKEDDGIDQATSSRLAAILRSVESAENSETKGARPTKARSLPPPKVRPNPGEVTTEEIGGTDAGRPEHPESRAERDLKRALEGRR